MVLTGDANPRSRGCSYRIEGGDLFPRTLVAQANTRISLENRDGTAHRVYSDTLPGLTALRTAPGRAREVAVPDAGRWELRDREYPQLVGHLVSIPDLAACATVTPRGEWRFSDVAAGTYVRPVRTPQTHRISSVRVRPERPKIAGIMRQTPLAGTSRAARPMHA